MTKLTKPQQKLYDELKRRGSISCIETYQPAKALVEKGLAKFESGKFGQTRLILS